MDDSSEVLRNGETKEFLKYLKKNRPDEYEELMQADILDYEDLKEIIEHLNESTGGVIDMYCYQETSRVNCVYNDKVEMLLQLEYLNKNASRERYFYREFRVY